MYVHTQRHVRTGKTRTTYTLTIMLLHIPELCTVLRGVERGLTFSREVDLDAFTAVFWLAGRGILGLMYC